MTSTIHIFTANTRKTDQNSTFMGMRCTMRRCCVRLHLLSFCTYALAAIQRLLDFSGLFPKRTQFSGAS